MLPIISRLMGLIIEGVVSWIVTIGRNRGWPMKAKKMIRVLYIAVMEVAISVIIRAQAFV